mmetsp:Transcript_15840/g.43203  ORF Transcript_15840/g.43203 Transcript_15840/m.43203 type:complete len:82 (+) Transcript_15840:90-335(+)
MGLISSVARKADASDPARLKVFEESPIGGKNNFGRLNVRFAFKSRLVGRCNLSRALLTAFTLRKSGGEGRDEDDGLRIVGG